MTTVLGRACSRPQRRRGRISGLGTTLLHTVARWNAPPFAYRSMSSWQIAHKKHHLPNLRGRISATFLAGPVRFDQKLMKSSLTMTLSVSTLKAAVETPLVFPAYPCNSQLWSGGWLKGPMLPQKGRPQRASSLHSSNGAIDGRLAMQRNQTRLPCLVG